MDVVKNASIEGTFRNLNQPQNWEMLLFAKVVFLDKTHANNHPMLYQLKDSIIGDSTHFLLTEPINILPNDAFVQLGDVVELDKKKKHALLSNKNTVAYEHLVIVSGTKPLHSCNDPELSAGLQALIDALKMKPNLSFATNNTHQNSAVHGHEGKPQNIMTKNSKAPSVEKFVLNAPLKTRATSSQIDLEAHQSRLYEIQL